MIQHNNIDLFKNLEILNDCNVLGQSETFIGVIVTEYTVLICPDIPTKLKILLVYGSN